MALVTKKLHISPVKLQEYSDLTDNKAASWKIMWMRVNYGSDKTIEFEQSTKNTLNLYDAHSTKCQAKYPF